MGLGTAIGAAVSIGGALIGSRSSNRAAETVADSTDAQIGLQREVYNDQRALQMPFYNTGVAANSAAAELLGVTPQQSAPQYGSGIGGNSLASQRQQDFFNNRRFESTGNFESGVTDAYGQPTATPNVNPGYSPTQPTPIAGDGSGNSNGYGQQASTGNNQLDALRNSPGYQFRMNEGMGALEQGAAARGGLLSGGHIRSGTRYAQDYASGEYNNRFNQLQALQSGGQAAAQNVQSAGSQFGANASNAMGANANFAANQQIQRGSMYGGALGSIGGMIGGSL